MVGRGNKCCFHNCENSKRSNPNLHLFKFPKSEELSQQWVINSGHVNLLDISPGTLMKNKVVCEDHFSEDDYRNTLNRKLLKKTAVPKHFSGGIVDEKSIRKSSPLPSTYWELSGSVSDTNLKKTVRTYKNVMLQDFLPDTLLQESSVVRKKSSDSDVSEKTKQWLDDITNMPTSSKSKRHLYDVPDSPKKKKMKKTIEHQRNLLKNERSTIPYLRNKCAMLKQTNKLQNTSNKIQFKSKYSRAVTSMQISHKKRTIWTRDEKELAPLTFYKSPSTYKFLRQKLKINLPALSTIRKWIGGASFRPGFDKLHFIQITRKVQVMEEAEKYCTIVFDEMKIDRKFEYSKLLDTIEGFEDKGIIGGRSKTTGTQVMVLLAGGLYSKWKIPLGYFVYGSAMKHTILKGVIIKAI
ncbi:unnamed protein product [Phaedon cochleariae]|uniref:THAP-type domain-containing protein n=1 Tax=Phaedon cochleariae TaxID=80249 RepID=A0A9N9SL01_PHACE|nr:unnamed protein product [Phaedon cochleariae]